MRTVRYPHNLAGSAASLANVGSSATAASFEVVGYTTGNVENTYLDMTLPVGTETGDMWILASSVSSGQAFDYNEVATLPHNLVLNREENSNGYIFQGFVESGQTTVRTYEYDSNRGAAILVVLRGPSNGTFRLSRQNNNSTTSMASDDIENGGLKNQIIVLFHEESLTGEPSEFTEIASHDYSYGPTTTVWYRLADGSTGTQTTTGNYTASLSDRMSEAKIHVF